MEIIKDAEQCSDLWWSLRKARMTASHAQEIGNNGKGLESYIVKLMAEYYSSQPKEQISNKDTERGIELEPVARDIYEFETGNKIEEVCFVIHSDYVGASPDGLVYKDGKLVKGLEIKCPNDENYLKILLDDSNIDSKYIWQIQMNMFVCGVSEWDYMAYNPNSTIQTHYIKTFYADSVKHEALRKGFAFGEKRIKEIKAVMDKKLGIKSEEPKIIKQTTCSLLDMKDYE